MKILDENFKQFKCVIRDKTAYVGGQDFRVASLLRYSALCHPEQQHHCRHNHPEKIKETLARASRLASASAAIALLRLVCDQDFQKIFRRFTFGNKSL